MEKNIKKERKIRKDKEQKKWTDAEVNKVLDFLSDNRNFEKPTAQIYYKRFLVESKLNATWDVVKYKVRYLKTCFGKAENWRNNTGAGILAEDAENGITTVNEKLSKMCRYYNRLADIFGNKRPCQLNMFDSDLNSSEFLGFMDSDELDNPVDDHIPETATTTPEIPFEIIDDELVVIENETQITPTQSSKQAKVTSFAEKLKRSAPKDSISQLAKFQADRNETQRLRIQFEEDKFKKEFDFKKEQFHAELELKKQELELKRKEVEKDEKIKILELEKNERLAKYEMDLKYKNK